MNVLELFSGTASFSKVARERGHECITLDNEVKFSPDICMDIMDFEPSVLDGWIPDIVWASPPCQCFSIMVADKNWDTKRFHAPKAKRPQTIMAMDIVKKTIDIIKNLQPRYFFIENPRGMLRKMSFMRGWHRSTVTYCKYGLKYQKATDIWNNCYHWKPRPVCSSKYPCHVRAPPGSRYGGPGVRADGKTVNSVHPFVMGEAKGQMSADKYTRRPSIHPEDMRSEVGWGKTTRRGIIPSQLCEEIIIACENNLK